MRKLLIVAAGLALAIAAANLFYVSLPAHLGKAKDKRNETVTMIAHLRWGIDPSAVVIDILQTSPELSMVDVDRSLFDIAESLKDRSFKTAQLAYRGHLKFQMTGSYFHQLGEERNWQNPVYTIRTMPSNLRDSAGLPAFETWTGGLLGVVGQEMKDHELMHRRWYIDDSF